MKELNRVVFEYKIDGEKHKVRKPNVEELREIRKAKSDDDLKATEGYLEKLGLPSEVFRTLEMQQIEEILEDLAQGKSQKPQTSK